MVNKVTLIGNLGSDPEIRRLESGAVVAKFSVATNESYKDKNGEWQDQTEWHSVVMWRNLAERAEAQLKKGSLVYVEGKLTHRSWQDQDGNPRKTTEVLANSFRMLNRREGGSGGGGYFPSADDEPPYIAARSGATMNDADKGAPAHTEQQAPPPQDDDLPF